MKNKLFSLTQPPQDCPPALPAPTESPAPTKLDDGPGAMPRPEPLPAEPTGDVAMDLTTDEDPAVNAAADTLLDRLDREQTEVMQQLDELSERIEALLSHHQASQQPRRSAAA